MGQAISYCHLCSTQLRDADFEKGKAFRVDSMAYCAACAPARSAPPAPDKPKKPVLPERTPRPRMSSSQTAISPVAAPRRGLLLGGAVLGACAVLVVVLLLSLGGSKPPAPAPEPVPLPRAVVKKPPLSSPLDEARAYARSHPDDLEGQIRRFEEIAFRGDQTPDGAEAKREVEALRKRELDAIKIDLATLEAELAGPLAGEAFGEAGRRLDAARHRQRGSQWKLAVEKREREIDDQVRGLFNPLKAKAADAKTKGATADLDAARRRVRLWDFRDYASALEAALKDVAPPPPPPPPTSSEAKGYLALWDKAMRRAAGRDLAGAAAELEAAALSEPAVREERAKDVADLKELARIYAELRKALSASDAAFLVVRGVSGRVMSIDADRVELSVDPRKPTLFFEWNEVPVAALLALLKMDVPGPLLALFRTLDGESDWAPDGKYRAWEPSRAAPSADELRARELYYGAERDYREMATRGKGIDGYARLLKELKETELVRRSRERIERRAEGGREAHFEPGELAMAGAFAPGKDGRLATTAEGQGNWIEWEYYARPSTAYRCWVLAGACCAEALDLHYQATGHLETDPKTKKRVPAEPGGALASPLKVSIRGLKSAHPAKEPKVPAKWDWIEVPLPKAVEGGAKRVRLFASAPGFGAAAVVVSSTLKKAPTDAEAQEIAAAKGPSRGSASPLLVLDDFEKDPLPWGYVGGQEFGPSKGDLTLDGALALGGKRSARLTGDFSGGGAYVGTWKTWSPPPGWDAVELRVWVKSENATRLGVRIVDNSDQCHQKNGGVALAPTSDWQELVLKVADLVGGEHWGGAKDGKWHAPVKGFGLNLGKDTMKDKAIPKATIWFDDLRVVLAPIP